MAKLDTSAYKTFDQICERLDTIVENVRDKDTSLERSLDLFDEAIALGSKAVGMVDSTELTGLEEALLHEREAEAAGAATGETTDLETAAKNNHATSADDAAEDEKQDPVDDAAEDEKQDPVDNTAAQGSEAQA